MIRADKKTMRGITAHARADIDAGTDVQGESLMLMLLEGSYGCLCTLTPDDHPAAEDPCHSTNALAN